MIFAILNLFKNVNDLQDISFFYNWTLRKLIRMKYPNKLILNKLRQLSYYGDGDDDGTFILNESNLKLEEIVKLSWNDNQPIFDLYENDEHFIRVAKLIK
ncbi:hypothetical protein CANARDRAFT_29799 [[Candida] arabinofermentans NRRL YB-2248]|uniref:Uncharacterized protein n=1 Tax=[Candida] arabinofermentans NRRL YB-2248 TaxID=983967 RepID=A0A1E4SVQ0_9ASCO|nr:hypothetical protein CANARDRAFT_29799 [[Candida] arabinofermentans NRRL YB-2248]